MKKPIIAITGGDPYFFVEIAGAGEPRGPFMAYPAVTTAPSTGRSFTVQIEAAEPDGKEVRLTETFFLPAQGKARPARSARRATPAPDPSPAPLALPGSSTKTLLPPV